MRKSNVKAVYETLSHTPEGSTLSSIAETTRISRPTVGKILQNLTVRKIVLPHKGETDLQNGGRPPVLYRINPQHHCSVLMRVHHYGIDAFVVDPLGRVKSGQTFNPEKCDSAVDTLKRALVATRQSIPNDLPVVRCVIVAMGILGDGELKRSSSFPELQGTIIESLTKEYFPGKVLLLNDSRVAASAALKEIGLDNPPKVMLSLHISEAIGIALAFNGTVVDGGHHAAGELGMDRDARIPKAEHKLVALARTNNVSIRDIYAAAAKQQPQAIKAVSDYCNEIAKDLLPIILAIDPEYVFISGAITITGSIISDAISQVVANKAFVAPKILLAEKDQSYVIKGAVHTISTLDAELAARN